MSDTTAKKLPDFQSTTIHGRIAHMEMGTYQEQEFLSLTLAHTISENTDVRIRFTNSNGLLTAFRNGNLVIGQELTVNGNIKGIRAFYMKDDELVPLKYPELQLRCTGYIFGSKPQVKAETSVPAAVVTPVAEPTLETIPF
jgi:hypothetical protein